MSFTEELMSMHYDQALSLRKQGFSYRAAIGAKIGVSKQAYYKCDGATSARKAAQESFALSSSTPSAPWTPASAA